MEAFPTWLKLVAVTSLLAEATAAVLVLWRPRPQGTAAAARR
ncbi:MAG: hypothetical protein ACRC50_05860 [Gaiella sp.]